MYFVNRSEIEKILEYFDDILEVLNQNTSFTNNVVDRLALERIIHVLVESILDTGNHMIDGFIMRDPGSYDDIIDILTDEKVLPENAAPSYKALIEARQQVVKQYVTIEAEYLADTIQTHKHVLQSFSTHIRTYLDQEMGVANAFSNETGAGEQG